MSVARLRNATDWNLTGLSGRNKERKAGSPATAGKSGVSVIIASSLSDSCNK